MVMISARARTAALAGIGLLAFFPTTNVRGQRLPVWQLTPEVRIGHDPGFTRILAILPASDGSVVIADAGNLEIGVFGREGAFSHAIGRTGRGPGEFETFRSVGLLGDTLWVIDFRLRRISFFSLDGRLLVALQTEVERSSSARSISDLTTFVPRGAALGLAGADFGSGSEFRDVLKPVLLMTRAGRTLDTLAWLPTKNENFVLARPDGGFTFGRQLFSDAGLIIVAPNALLFFLVDRSVTTTPRNAVFRVVAIGSNGDTLSSRRYAYVPKRLEKTRGDSLLAAAERVNARSGLSPGEIRRAVFIPDYYSPVTSGIAGSDGSLWLRREEGKPTVDYWVIGKDGALLAAVTVPANLTLMAVTDSEAWGVEKDQYDVPTVIRYRINR